MLLINKANVLLINFVQINLIFFLSKIYSKLFLENCTVDLGGSSPKLCNTESITIQNNIMIALVDLVVPMRSLSTSGVLSNFSRRRGFDF